ncbi:putative ribonuclease H-like domain, reverse transcriptase zinc-binding domain-containing protein [Senna tora]|uniref:Putative ribonuclease H-like domain, reverse transcriptase zinc-binding domain-containing protein n=1 Tax=Senna tora TaxID=362788 RepID=A0A834TXF3_9FABA|nr:putative ribonuclease H-like domain, reverse transcriptase zinc-binding domain-containing protein [Senna tora]
MMLQDSNQESEGLSKEDKDLFSRSKKKVKPNDGGSPTENDDGSPMIEGVDASPMEVLFEVNGNGVPEGVVPPVPMEADLSIVETTKDANMQDAVQGPEVLKPVDPDEEKKPAKELSYKEKLLGINGRCDCPDSEDDQDSISAGEVEKDQVAPPSAVYPGPPSANIVEVGEENFGPWIIPQRNTRRKPRQAPNLGTKQNDQSDKQANTSTRFVALSNLEDKDPEPSMSLILAKPMEVVVVPQGPQWLPRVRTEDSSSHNWKNIWKCDAIERARVFLWSLAHNSILTNEVRVKRRMTLDASCIRCNGSTKSPLHAVRDCPKVCMFWKALVKPSMWTEFFNLNHTDWIGQNLSRNWSNETGVNWNSLFSSSCWFIWKQRNSCVFSGCQEEASSLIPQIKAHVGFIDSLDNQILKDSSINSSRHSVVGWKAPENGWFKLNTDGSCLANGSISCGGVLRDHNGTWIHGFSKKLGSGDVLLAEGWSILSGLLLAKDKGLSNIIVETDSNSLVKLLNCGCPETHPLSPLIEKIHGLGAQFENFRVTHCFRESNHVADALAFHAHSQAPGVLFFDRSPSFCSLLLLRDLRGSTLLRRTRS